jgi:hypothetical protein
MSYSPGVGLVLGLGLDSSGVQPGIEDFDKLLDDATEKWNHDFQEAADETDRALLSNRESVRLLGEELGVHLPRAVSIALAEMLPGINAIGPALLSAFAIAEIPKFVHEVEDATTALGGYTKAVEAAEKADIDASNSALIHFATIVRGAALIAETNRALANLAAKQGDWKEEVKAADQAMHDMKGTLTGFLGPIGEAINLYRGYKAAVKETSDTEGEAAKLRERLDQQLDQMTKLQADRQKEAAKAAKEGAREAELEAKEEASAEYRAAEEKYQANQKAFHASEEALRRQFEMENRVGHAAVERAREEAEAQERLAKATQRLTEELRKQQVQREHLGEELGKETERQVADIERIGREQEKQAERGKNEARQRIEDEHNEAVAAIQAHQQDADAIARLKGDYAAMAQAGIAAYNALAEANANYLKQLEAQHKAEQKAAQEATNAALTEIGALAEGAAQLAGSKKGYYAVKAGEEVAAGLEAIAEGTWPPNPLAIAAAGIHFESAAEYAKLAGTSAGHRGAGAPGGGGEYGVPSGGEEYRGGGGRTGAGDQFVAGSGLAPGAQGSNGGRLNVIIIGESEQARFFADRVNEADKAGHFITVSAARRSAPAQG